MSKHRKIKVGDKLESNNYGTMEVIEVIPRFLVVRFLNTGYEVKVNRANALAGKVKDVIASFNEINSWKPYHKEFVNNSGDKFVSLKKMNNKLIVGFPDTGTVLEVYENNANNGKVADPYKPTRYGVGFTGEFNKGFHKSYWKQARQLWQNMMKRCYCEVDDKGYYGRATVDTRWHNFSLFLEDITTLEGFDKWLAFQVDGTGVRYNLDKDTKDLNPDNIYSKHFCKFITDSENKSHGSKSRWGTL